MPSEARPALMPRGFPLTAAAVILSFSWPLYQLARFSIGHELYSHIILIPLISLYLVWQARPSLPAPSSPDRPLAAIIVIAGSALLVTYGCAVTLRRTPEQVDALALTTLSFLSFFTGTVGWFWGRQTVRALAFPLFFLLFMVPFPSFFITWIEALLQQGSAAVAHALFTVAGTTFYFEQLTFQLSTISIRVAPECSGIHSSLALFITSTLAGHFFLRSPGKRTVLALAVIPLALLRNGFRIFVLGELCVHIGPEMIDSYIHHQGGPIFFILSLLPFFLLLVFLVKSERNVARPMS